MSRSLWKGPFYDTFLHTSYSQKENRSKIVKIWSRRSTILPQFIDQNFQIHNGKQFIKLKVSEDMVGHKFGEFALTRKKPVHKVKTKIKKK